MKITPQPVLLLLCKTVETMKQVKRKICHIVLLKKKVNLAYGSVVNTISNLSDRQKLVESYVNRTSLASEVQSNKYCFSEKLQNFILRNFTFSWKSLWRKNNIGVSHSVIEKRFHRKKTVGTPEKVLHFLKRQLEPPKRFHIF